MCDEVALLQRDGDEDVEGQAGGEDQVADGHVGRRPEGDDEADVERVAHRLVEERRAEPGGRRAAALVGVPDLAQPEELEVVEEEGRDDGDQPAEVRQAHERRLRRPTRRRPDERRRDRAPPPEEEREQETGREHVAAALGGRGDDARPPALEARPRHDAVLHGEEREEQRVDEHGLAERRRRAAEIHARQRGPAEAAPQVADEANGVGEDHEEDGVAGEPVDEDSGSRSHGGERTANDVPASRPQVRSAAAVGTTTEKRSASSASAARCTVSCGTTPPSGSGRSRVAVADATTVEMKPRSSAARTLALTHMWVMNPQSTISFLSTARSRSARS